MSANNSNHETNQVRVLSPRERQLANLKPQKPGNNGNGGGRPKGSRSFSTILKELLKTKDPTSGKYYSELLVENAIKRAINRGGRDLDVILERTEGSVKQGLELSGKNISTTIVTQITKEMPYDDALKIYRDQVKQEEKQTLD